MDLSDEQNEYITYLDKTDTRLLATAGSGKTLCIIRHTQYLVQHNVYTPHEIVMLTFSNAKDDFVHKLDRFKVQEVL